MLSIDSALRDLRTAIQRGEKVMCVHYACENFYEVTDQPIAVTCVAVAEPDAGQEHAFSIANAPAADNTVEREKDLLKRFYEVLSSSPDARIVHWNMHSSSYGFTAIAARYRYLLGQNPPITIQADRLYDLDAMIEAGLATPMRSIRNLEILRLSTVFTCRTLDPEKMKQMQSRLPIMAQLSGRHQKRLTSFLSSWTDCWLAPSELRILWEPSSSRGLISTP